MITPAQLAEVMPKLSAAKLQLCLPHLNDAMQSCAIDTPLRASAFLAQIAHESGELLWMEEIWGPTPSQLRYEPPGDLAARLGNTLPGDGRRFKGRGPIQITGRFNYGKFGELLGHDLVAAPDTAATPEVAFAVAGLFWRSNGLNELADVRDFITITRRINGGLNGLADRQAYYDRAKVALNADAAASRDAPLMRGHEAIFAAANASPASKRAAADRPFASKMGASNTATKTGTAKKPTPKHPSATKRAAGSPEAARRVKRATVRT